MEVDGEKSGRDVAALRTRKKKVLADVCASRRRALHSKTRCKGPRVNDNEKSRKRSAKVCRTRNYHSG